MCALAPPKIVVSSCLGITSSCCHVTSEEEAYRVASWLGAFYLFPSTQTQNGPSSLSEWTPVGTNFEGVLLVVKKTEKFENTKISSEKTSGSIKNTCC